MSLRGFLRHWRRMFHWKRILAMLGNNNQGPDLRHVSSKKVGIVTKGMLLGGRKMEAIAETNLGGCLRRSSKTTDYSGAERSRAI